MLIRRVNKQTFSKPEIEFLEISDIDIITTSIRTCTVGVSSCSCKCYYASDGKSSIVYHWNDVCAGQVCWNAWAAKGYTNQLSMSRNYN